MFICIRCPAARKKGVLRVQISVVREGQEEGRPPAHQYGGSRFRPLISPAVCSRLYIKKDTNTDKHKLGESPGNSAGLTEPTSKGATL